MQRILLVRFSSLGDMILLDALVREVKERSPRAETWLVTKPEYAPLYQEDPQIDVVAVLPPDRGGLWRLRKRLLDVDFDLVLDAHGSLRSHLLCFGLSDAPARRIAKDTLNRLLFLKARVDSPRLRRHQVDRYLALAGAEGKAVRPRLALSEADHAAAQEILSTKKGPFLALAPFSRHRPKEWPASRFAALARGFLDSHAGELVLVGSAAEREACEELTKKIPAAAVITAGELDLRGTAALLSRCNLLVCNDSGLMHLAEAVQTPVLAIFGPTSRQLGYFPLDAHSRVVENDLPCRPCSRNGSRPCHLKEQLCLTLSSVERVAKILDEAWTEALEETRA